MHVQIQPQIPKITTSKTKKIQSFNFKINRQMKATNGNKIQADLQLDNFTTKPIIFHKQHPKKNNLNFFFSISKKNLNFSSSIKSLNMSHLMKSKRKCKYTKLPQCTESKKIYCTTSIYCTVSTTQTYDQTSQSCVSNFTSYNLNS